MDLGKGSAIETQRIYKVVFFGMIYKRCIDTYMYIKTKRDELHVKLIKLCKVSERLNRGFLEVHEVHEVHS